MKAIKAIAVTAIIVLLSLSCSRRAGPITIKVAAKAHPFLLKYKVQLEANFRKRYNQNLQFILLDTTIYENDLLRLLSSQDEDIPDIAEMDSPQKFTYLQALIPLNHWVEHWDLISGDDAKRDFAYLRADPQGRILGLCQYYPEPLVIVLRRDWLLLTGRPFPTTVEELLAVTKSFSAPAFHQRLGHPVYAWAWEPRLHHLILKAYDNAVVEFDAKTGKYVPGFTSTMAQAELSTLCDLYRRRALPPELFQTPRPDMVKLFKEDRLGMLIMPLTQALALSRRLGPAKVAFGGLPRGSVKPANGLVSVWSLVSLSRQPEAAWDFFRWWFSPETFELLCFGFNPSTAGSPGQEYYVFPLLSLFNQQVQAAQKHQPWLKAAHDIIIHERMQFTGHPYQQDIEGILETYYWYAISGSLSVEAALQGAVVKIEKMHLLK